MKGLIRATLVALALVVALIGFRMLSDDYPDAATTDAGGNAGSEHSSRAVDAAGGGGAGGGRPAALVVASEVTQILTNNRLKAVGNGAAKASVSVVPLSGGILTDVLVSAGQRVDADAVLARLDNEEQKIARDRAISEASEAEADASRLERLLRSNTSTQVELNRARAALTDAKLALRDAELTLSRRTITAPIAGIVGFVSLDSGNYIDAQTELLTIDDRSSLVLEFWVPERFANKVSLQQIVKAVALSDAARTYEGVISGIGSRIEPDSRTLPVKARLDNEADTLRPGMSFELLLDFPGQEYPAVDPLAIQWDSTGSFVWRITDNKVQRIPARIIQRNPESVLVDAALIPGDQVVIEGLLSLRPGAVVRVEGSAPPPRNTTDGSTTDRTDGRAASGSSTGS